MLVRLFDDKTLNLHSIMRENKKIGEVDVLKGAEVEVTVLTVKF